MSLNLKMYASLAAEVPHSLGAQWCYHLRTTPEPDVIIYPRIPKAGSSTIKSLINQLQALNNATFHWDTSSEYWTDLDINPDIKHNFIKQTKMYRDQYRKPVIIDGHFKQTIFEAHDLHARRVEYISLARECGPRLQSHFFYDLYDGSAAKLASVEGEEAVRTHKSKYLRSNMSVEECVADRECLLHSEKLTYKTADISRYFCGYACNMALKRNIEKGSQMNLLNFSMFTVSGTTERIKEFISMLECAYPTTLRGIEEIYANESLHVKAGSHHNKQASSVEMNTLVDEVCSKQSNVYSRIYSSLSRTSSSIYHYMITHREGCCRRTRASLKQPVSRQNDGK